MTTSESSYSFAQLYKIADERVLCRTIRELHYEGLLEELGTDQRGGGAQDYAIEADGGVIYRFRARRSLWGDLHVVGGTVVRESQDGSAGFVGSRTVRLLLDARQRLGLDPIVLSHLIEEMHNTIEAEAAQCSHLHETAERLSLRRGVGLESRLDGHPKIIGSRGRLGWGRHELKAYAPEFLPRFQVEWLAARSHCDARSLSGGRPSMELLRQTMGEAEWTRLQQAASRESIDLDHDVIFPVHPWQWERFVHTQYAAELVSGHLVHLGPFGEPYRPRGSIRTLAHSTRPDAPDLKLSLTIMNTSCYRGIGVQQLKLGKLLSHEVAALAQSDTLLRDAGVVILEDLEGVHYSSSSHTEAAGPYRYQEMLAAIWRQSPGACIDPTRQDIPAAALYQRNLVGDSLVRHWVGRSGWSPERWLTQLFEHTVVPLYHLLCCYGLGVIAHGQNVSILLCEGKPTGMILRDFHGDVRLVDKPWPEEAGVGPEVTEFRMRRLPIEELMHDLFTGHFVSVLRFVALVFGEDLGVNEQRFYSLLGESLQRYRATHPALDSRVGQVAIDRTPIERICVNRARFRIGYSDAMNRPLPDLGPALVNPLTLAMGR